MKRLILSTLLLATAAVASGSASVTGQVLWKAQSGGTAAPPTGACAVQSTGTCTDGGDPGLCLDHVVSLHAVVVCSNYDAGGTVTAGSENGYYCSRTFGWMPSQTYTNFTVTTGGGIEPGPELAVAQPVGRVLYAPSGVTCSVQSDGGAWDGGLTTAIEAGQQ